jgi:D-lactate dehydrogenase
MWELKELFDPDYILNPGVILNKDPLVRRQRVLAGAIM